MAEAKEWQQGKRTRPARKRDLAERQQQSLKPSLSSFYAVGRWERRANGVSSPRAIPRRRGCSLLI